MNFAELIATGELTEYQEPPTVEPPQLPVSVLDLERATDCFDMQHHMQDACPACGGFRMLVGDWACWGVCGICATGEP